MDSLNNVAKRCDDPCDEEESYSGKKAINLNLFTGIQFQFEKFNQDCQVLPEKVITTGQHRSFDQVNNFTEEEILRQLLFAFNGISGKLFQKSYNLQFRVSHQLKSCPSLYQHASHLAHLGTLNLFIQKCIRVDSPIMDKSLYLTALTTALRFKLSEFMGVVSQLETQLMDKKQTSTLATFRLLTFRPFHEMKWLATVAFHCYEKKSHILTTLNTLMQHGDHTKQQLLKSLFSQVAEVFYAMLGAWLKGNEFNDPYSEFFITKNEICPVKNFKVKDVDRIRREMLPCFVTYKNALSVLNVGRNIYLLKSILKSNSPVSSLKQLDGALHEAIYNEIGSAAWKNGGVISCCVENILNESSTLLRNVMLEKCDLTFHLRSLAGHFLLRQGCYVKELLNKLGPILNQPLSDILIHNLKRELDSAILDDWNGDPKVVDFIQVIIHPCLKFGSTGWDNFALDYVLADDEPATLVITKECIDKYKMLFQELIVARRIQWVLNDAFISLQTFARISHSAKISLKVKNFPRAIHILLFSINQFVQHLVGYLQSVQVEQHWRHFEDVLNKAPSLDCIISAHMHVLDNILNCSLFQKEGSNECTSLKSLYNLTLKLQSLCNSVCASIIANKQSRAGGQNSRHFDLEAGGNSIKQLNMEFKVWMNNFLVSHKYLTMTQNLVNFIDT